MPTLQTIRHKRNMKRVLREMERGRFSLICDAPAPIAEDIDFIETVEHFNYLIPSDSQGRLPACGGFSMANWIEWKMNTSGRPIKKGYQIDGEAIWWEGRKLFFGGGTKGGLGMAHPPEAAMSLEAVIGTYKVVTASEALRILPERPLLCAMRITSNWTEASHKNGFVKPGGLSTGNHFLLLCGATINEGKSFVHMLNSWGTLNGKKGIVTLELSHYFENCLGCVDIQCALDEPERLLIK